MRVFSKERKIVFYDSLESTQEEAHRCIKHDDVSVCAVVAGEQTLGRGRFGRDWYSPYGECLAISFLLWEYADWERMELLAMAIGLGASIAFDTQIAWPNDLVLSGKKVGGVLGEVFHDNKGRAIPVIGLGVNLKVKSFPEAIREIATSLALEGREVVEVEGSLNLLKQSLSEIPEPHNWSDLVSLWTKRDATASKKYRLQDGRVGTATGINNKGWLIVEVEGKQVEVPSAEAFFG